MASSGTEASQGQASSVFRMGFALLLLVLALRLGVVGLCAYDVRIPGLSYILRPLAISGGDAADYNTMATNLLAGEGLTENEGAAARQPLFPLMLAGIYAMFSRSALALAIVHALLGAITAVLCWEVVRQHYSATAAFLGAVMVGVGFDSLRYMVRVRQEPLTTLIVVAAVLAHAHAGRSRRHWLTALAGGLVGLAYLCRTPFLLFSGFGAWWLYWRWSKEGTASVVRLVPYGLGVAAVVTPWLVRNVLVTGHTSPLTERAATFLWAANAPPAKTVWEDPPHGDHEGLGREDGRAYGRRLSEELGAGRGWSREQIRRYRVERARAYVLKHPGRYLELSLSRLIVLWQLWPSPPPPVAFFIGLWGVYLVSVIGGWIAWRKFPESRLFVAVIATFTIVHVLTHGIPRYKASAMPFVWLLFAYGAHWIVIRWWESMQRSTRRKLAETA